jgi:hypothetical protein
MAAAEQKKSYAVIKNFKGLNTKANRTAIDEEEFSWIENAMPIGFANIKIVPAPSTVRNSGNTAVAWGNTVTFLTSANINISDYILAFEADGRAEYFSLTSLAKGNVAVSGTFSNSGVSVAQYKNERVMIGDPSKGLFTWNGTDLISIGGVGVIGITNAGTGYTSTPAVVISAPNQTNGVQATAQAYTTANTVTSIVLTNAGTGYTSSPTVTITGGSGSNATAVSSLVTFATGTVYVQVTNGGSGYTNAANTVVTIGDSSGWTTQAAGAAVLSGGQVNQIVMTNSGAGYTNSSNVIVTITGGGGSNATATGYVQTDQIVDVATFSGRVWVAAGRTVTYSAAGSYSDFTSVSAGSFTLTDSTLHGNIQSTLSANNFLYIFGDDSINVFSDLRVSTTGQTLFTNTNVSASVGSKRPYAVFPYFRSVLFMNDYGMYALVGSTTSKISDPMDGVFPYIDFTRTVTAGQVLLNNILCAAFNFYLNSSFPITTGSRYVQAIFFEKKWFITSQGALTYITSAPLGGLINMYGTSGTDLVRLYGDASANISSTIQSSLSPMKDPIRTKQALKFGVEATLTTPATFDVTVDSETSSSPIYSLTNTGIDWVNNVGIPIPWVNNFSTVIPWVASKGYNLYKSDAQQYGKYLGLTITSNNPAFIINTIEFEHELRVRF